MLQIAEAVGVIQDVRESIANMRRFKSDLDIAADDAEEHRADGPVVDLTRGQRTSDLADGSWHTLERAAVTEAGIPSSATAGTVS